MPSNYSLFLSKYLVFNGVICIFAPEEQKERTMKKYLFLLMMSLFTMTSYAQTNHMKFKGIPMEGTQSAFVKKLVEKGFVYVGMESGAAILEGEFATIKDCTIAVERFSDRDQVSMVAVIFPEEDTWNGVAGCYFSLKGMLKEKYGIPYCVEKFSNGDPEDDFLRFRGILQNECQYMSEFTCENGKIQLTMKKQSYNSASAVLRYIDNANALEKRKKMLDDL